MCAFSINLSFAKCVKCYLKSWELRLRTWPKKFFNGRAEIWLHLISVEITRKPRLSPQLYSVPALTSIEIPRNSTTSWEGEHRRQMHVTYKRINCIQLSVDWLTKALKLTYLLGCVWLAKKLLPVSRVSNWELPVWNALNFENAIDLLF